MTKDIAKKFQNKYRLKSARAEWHDYGGGVYFVTVCTKQREHFFGEIKDGQMQLSSIGEYLFENLQNVTQHYPYAEIPLFVVMPNHWHAIVFIDGDKTPYIRRDTDNDARRANCRDVACHVSDEYPHHVPIQYAFENQNNDVVIQQNDETMERNVVMERDVARHVSTNETMINIRAMKGWLSVAIGGLKSSITKFANTNKIDFAWQTRFHDHIIRDTTEMNRIADYIENNPDTWDTDCFNK